MAHWVKKIWDVDYVCLYWAGFTICGTTEKGDLFTIWQGNRFLGTAKSIKEAKKSIREAQGRIPWTHK